MKSILNVHCWRYNSCDVRDCSQCISDDSQSSTLVPSSFFIAKQAVLEHQDDLYAPGMAGGRSALKISRPELARQIGVATNTVEIAEMHLRWLERTGYPDAERYGYRYPDGYIGSTQCPYHRALQHANKGRQGDMEVVVAGDKAAVNAWERLYQSLCPDDEFTEDACHPPDLEFWQNFFATSNLGEMLDFTGQNSHPAAEQLKLA